MPIENGPPGVPSQPFAIAETVRPLLPSSQVVFTGRGLSKVSRSGKVEVHALRDVSLGICRGEFVVLLGAWAAESPHC